MNSSPYSASLEYIKNALFGAPSDTGDTASRPEDAVFIETVAAADLEDAEPPPWFDGLMAVARRKRDSLGFEQHFDAAATQPGQVVLLDAIHRKDGGNPPAEARLNMPLALVLDERSDLDPMVWQAWVATRFTDYASYWDVLPGSDVPVDPRVGMVQAWNSVMIHLGWIDTQLVPVPPDTLDAIRAVRDEFLLQPECQAMPRAGPRRTLRNRVVHTGPPFSDATDERRAFARLYSLCGSEISAACRAESRMEQRTADQAEPAAPNVVNVAEEMRIPDLGNHCYVFSVPLPANDQAFRLSAKDQTPPEPFTTDTYVVHFGDQMARITRIFKRSECSLRLLFDVEPMPGGWSVGDVLQVEVRMGSADIGSRAVKLSANGNALRAVIDCGGLSEQLMSQHGQLTITVQWRSSVR